MLYYLAIFAYILFCWIWSSQPGFDKGKSDFLYWSVFLLFWFTAGWRYETGTDYFAYDELYRSTTTLGEAQQAGGITSDLGTTDIGYMLLNSLFRTIGTDINIMFFLIAFVTNLLLFGSIGKYLPRYRFPCILAYYTFCFFTLDMNGIRQSIAVCIFIYSLRYIQQRQTVRYAATILIAALFHLSAVVVLPLYWIVNRRFPSWLLYTTTMVGFTVIALRIPVVEILVQKLIVPILPWAGAVYKLGVYTSEEGIKAWGLNSKLLLYMAGLVYIIRRRKLLDGMTPYANILLNLFAIYIFCRGMLWESIELNSRINYYFIFGLIAGLVMLPDTLRIAKNRLIASMLLIAVIFYQGNLWLLGSVHAKSYLPYQNYLVHRIFDLPSTGRERLNQQAEAEQQ